MINRFTAKVQNGMLKILDRQMFKQIVSKFGEEPFTLEVKAMSDQRTARQNNYYWGIVIPIISDHCGCDNEYMHAELKAIFLSEKVVIKDKERGLGQAKKTINMTKFTSELDKKEFADYIDKIKAWALSFDNIVIPEPEEDFKKV